MSKLLPAVVACNGAVVVASENSDPTAALVLKLRTEGGQEVLLPLSERATKQVQKVISEFNRSRDLLFVEERTAAAAPLQ
jgi:hypothetical protein